MTKSNPSEIENQGPAPEKSTEEQTQKDKQDVQELSLQQEVGISLDEIEVPVNLSLRIAKDVLPENIKFQKESKLALAKAATVFASYLGSAAQDICSKTKRKQITPADVLAALDSIDFTEMVSPLTEYLEIQREISRAKKANTNEGPSEQLASEQEQVQPMEE